MQRFRNIRDWLRAPVLCAVLLTLLVVPGCSMGYTNLHPGENSGLYQHLFADIISRYDEPHWLWVRGTISGDLNGDGTVSEEIVLATIQKGTHRAPGPIEMAFLVACSVAADGTRQAIARQLLFDNSPIPRAPKARNDVDRIVDMPFNRCRAQMIQDKVTLTETVLVYFWADPLPGPVWYVGYALGNQKFVKNLETVIWQLTPGVMTQNLDRSIEASPYGYQLVFSVAALPEHIMAKIGKPSEAPMWGHVFARNAQGYYEQADERFGSHYSMVEGQWNQAYLKAIVKGLPPEELAWFEYYLAIMNNYTGTHDLAEAFIAKARNNAVDAPLIEAIPKIERMINPVRAAQEEEKRDQTDRDVKPPVHDKYGERHSDWNPGDDWDGDDWVPSAGGIH